MQPQVGSRPAAREYAPGATAAIRPRRWHRRLAPVAWAALALALFACFLHVSRTEPSDSYGPDFTLQAWDMLHGNLLLHGWWLSDVSFYTTELPEYMLVVLIRGANAGVVHVAAAITYTLLVLTAALLARGRQTGRQGLVAAVLTAGIMLCPEHGNGVFVLLLAPDHVGTCVPVLLAWLILDRARPRWYVPVAVAALLAWVLVADPLVLLIAVVPLVVVCGWRVWRGAARHRLPLRSQWYELSLIAAGLAAAAAAELALWLIRAAGGFVVAPVAPGLTGITQLPHHLLLAAEGLLLLFGADPSGQHPGIGLAVPLVHLAGLALAAWGTCVAVRRFGRDGDLVAQLLVTALALNLAGFVLWSSVTGITSAREMAPVLPFAAVLAGRLLAGRLAAARLLPALSVVLLAYLGSLVQLAALPPQPPQFQPLASWLIRHDLRYGLGSNWLDGAVTVGSGERVHLLPVSRQGGILVPSRWEAQASWFDPRLHDANFVALIGRPAQPPLWTARATFGPPAHTRRFAAYTVLVWKKNLLAELAAEGHRRHRGGRDDRT